MSKLPVASGDEADAVEIVDKETVAQKLMKLAVAHFDLGRDENNEPFAVQKQGANVALPIGGKAGAMSKLAGLYYKRAGKVATANALSEVKRLLESQAMEKPKLPLPMRVGRATDSGDILIDCGDSKGRAIQVTAEGWEVISRSPGAFRRGVGREMEEPARDGSPEAMRKLFNFDDDTWEFMINWQVLAFIPNIEHVMPIIEGTPGTAKSSATKYLAMIVDPSDGTLCSPPKDTQALEVAAGGSWVYALENISVISPEISDGLARLITGAGNRERELYTNSGTHTRELRRIVIMNGIHVIGMRPDLLDRSIKIDATHIARFDRKTSEQVEDAFYEAAPGHLGFLLDTLSAILRLDAEGTHDLGDYGRMAGFERWLHLCDIARGTKTLEWYTRSRDGDAVALALDDLVTIELETYLSSGAASATRSADMSAAAWLSNLTEPTGNAKKQWPASAISFTQRLRMLQSGLERAGWKVAERNRDGRKWWKIELPEK